jgi:hypothetical protein
MKQVHQPHDIRMYAKGANRDLDDELMALAEGQYIDACNMRTNPMDGDNSSAKKIKGEVSLYPNIDNRCNIGTGLPLSTSYECIGVSEINRNIVEFWADAAEVEPSMIRVNGQIVLMSDEFPIQAKYPLQIAKNESCIGGEVYITDYNVTPMIFNIKDLLLNSGIDVGTEQGDCTTKYFADFNLEEYLLILTRAVDRAAFVKLDAGGGAVYDKIFGTLGLNVGYASWSFRYVTTAGDRTAWSAPTPLCPIIKRSSSGCTNFPYVQSISKDPDTSSPSIFGAHIKFRVNNEDNYDFIEVRRDSWDAGGILGAPPTSVIAGVYDLINGQFGIIDILDKGGSEEILTIDDVTEVMAAVSRAKAIRYFNEKLYLMNIEYGSRDIDAEVTLIGEDTNTPAFPTVQKIFKAGHSDPYTGAYYKSNMRGEKEGYAIILWDDQGQWTYAKKITGAENYENPSRRFVTTSEADGTSYLGTVRAANTDGEVSQTYEVFDLADATQKTDFCSWKNILDKELNVGNPNKIAGDGLSPLQPRGVQPNLPSNILSNCPKLDTDIRPDGLLGVRGATIGSALYAPYSQDSNCDAGGGTTNGIGHDYIVNLAVSTDTIFKTRINYRPNGFSPDYYSLGTAFKGVNVDAADFPKWATAFSIVKTPSAGKVVAQGLGFYNMITADNLGTGSNTTKETNSFAIYFPDLDAETGINPTVIEEMKTNPASFAIELVSPLGFFSEIFSFDQNLSVGNVDKDDSRVDMISYCRIIRDDDTGVNTDINPLESNQMGIKDDPNPLAGGGARYVAYGKWRAKTQFSPQFADGQNGERYFDLSAATNITEKTVGGGQTYYILTGDTFTGAFYRENTAGASHSFIDADVQDWHEPVYAVNIIRRAANIPDTNTTDYLYAGHYQKIKSLIGISDGTVSQIYPLVDERWEDCIQKYSGQVQNAYDTLERFVRVKDASGNIRRWLNVDNKSAIDLTTILTSLQATGSHDVTDTSGTYTIYGVYRSTQGSDATAPTFDIVFNWFDTTYSREFFVPDNGDEIYVYYDKRIPIRVFGGDTWINENVWALQDNRFDAGSNTVAEGEDFKLNVGFPHMVYYLNDRIYIANRTTGSNKIQNGVEFQFSNSLGLSQARMRQMILMWTAETRINLSFAFNNESGVGDVTPNRNTEYFPLKNYIMRPYDWKDDLFESGTAADVMDDNNMTADYTDVYGKEYLLWGWGGFRYRQRVNIDYSKYDNTRRYNSVPQVGFEEQNLFCTRIIYSNPRPINVQNTPTVRTFPEDNVFDLDDGTGEIKFAWSADSAKGNNLYALTDSGVALLLVDKRILSEINANELATIGSDVGGILSTLWLDREVGMSDEMWRSAAEYRNRLYWVNNDSAFSLEANVVSDIGRVGYHSKIYPEYIEKMDSGYTDYVTGVYDVLHDEYWVNFKKGGQNIQSHTFQSRLQVVDDLYGDGAFSGSYFGVAEGETLELTILSDVVGVSGSGVLLGGTTGNLLRNQVCIKVAQASPYPISVWGFIGTTLTLLVTLNQGECSCFKATFEENSDGGVSDVIDSWKVTECEIESFACPTLAWQENTKSSATRGSSLGAWQGGFDYNFDRYLSFDNKTYGMRDAETFLLDEGRIINGQQIEAFVIQASVPAQFKDKEFIRIRVNSDNKPVKVEFFNDLPQLLAGNVQAELDTVTNPLALKDYYGFEQFIPRKTAAPKNRMQGRLLIFKIIHNLDEDFRVSTTDVQYKLLK